MGWEDAIERLGANNSHYPSGSSGLSCSGDQWNRKGIIENRALHLLQSYIVHFPCAVGSCSRIPAWLEPSNYVCRIIVMYLERMTLNVVGIIVSSICQSLQRAWINSSERCATSHLSQPRSVDSAALLTWGLRFFQHIMAFWCGTCHFNALSTWHCFLLPLTCWDPSAAASCSAQ